MLFSLKKINLVKTIVIWLIILAPIYTIANNKSFSFKINPFLKENDSILEKRYSKILKNFTKGEYATSLKNSFLLLEDSNKQKNHKTKHLILRLIADIFDKTKKQQKSLNYYKLSLKALQKEILFKKEKEFNSNNNSLFSEIYLRIGSAFQKIHLNQVKKTTNKYKDSAITYYEKLENISGLNNDNLKHKAISYSNLSAIYEQDSIFDKAETYALKAIQTHKLRKNKINQANSLNNLGNIYLSSKEFKRAKNIYKKGIELIKHNDSPKSIKVKANLYYNLAWAMRNLKDYKAYDFQELSYEIEDFQREKEIRRIIEEVTVKHKENLAKQRVNLVVAKRKLIEAKEDKTSILFGTLSLLVIIISGGIIYNYKLRQKNLQLKLSENNLIQQQSIEKIKSEAQTKIINATIDGKESERKQIAEILHDNVSALLSSANMHLSATKKQFNDNTPQEIEKTQAIILEASQKVRDLSHNLISSILLKFGLEYALKDIVKKYSNSQLKFNISANNINRYHQDFEIKIFNIIQELTNNILKHSKASVAQIIITQKEQQLSVIVNDNGIGFYTLSPNTKNTGIGLNQIEARVQMMNGKFNIVSEKNKGTNVFINVPIQQQKKFNLSSVG
ncbi:tetratricopeptide repeat-containing sensor histidine kinase [Tenacibaculum soleae]|uniref:tetratricopeptide repeat-containing sensor histidine kinase n=1 Tax=Tenacibaculum soleae TaxID=447689 RepID=UPI000A046693|nr:tetratricopeptide repeat-containing sensor histidine kinase [Tenacibaculum soleae]